MDTSNLIYPALAIEEGVRLALGEYNLLRSSFNLAALEINGLDGAAATTVPAAHDSLIVVGAAAYTIAGRHIDRTETFDFNEKLPKELADWGKSRYGEFRRLLNYTRDELERDRKNELRTTTNLPYGPGWKMDSQDDQT
jgi:hypothetical protein